MESGNRRRPLWLARFALLLAALVGGLWLASLDYEQKISTNVLDLIPSDEREPELQMVRSLVNEQQTRLLWLVLRHPGEPVSAEAAERFGAVLAADPAIAEILRVDRNDAQEELGRYLFEHRLEYLLPNYLDQRLRAFDAAPSAEFSQWLATRVVDELEAFLSRPESTAFEELIPSDPLLLTPALADVGSLLAPPPDAEEAVLFWARINPSPLADEGQEPVFATIERALQAARGEQPNVQLEWTGVNRFAAASKARIRAEMTWLNTGSIAAVLLVSALLVRRPWRVFHLVPAVLFSLLGAWVGVTLLVERVHILVFVIGALLTGVAIDYGFHLFLHAPTGPGERFRDRWRPILKPLLVSCLTTVIGFALLWFSDLPLLRHVGIFVCAGLVSALAAALLYFRQLTVPPLEPRRGHASRSGGQDRPRAPWWVIVLVVLVLGGLARLHWHDDIRELEVPSPELSENDEAVRARFGESGDRTAYLVSGATLAEARERLDAVIQRAEEAGQPLVSAAAFLPSPRQLRVQSEHLRRLTDFPLRLAEELTARGFESAAFEPFFADWRRAVEAATPTFEALVENVRPHLRGPAALLFHEGNPSAWWAAITPEPLFQAPLPTGIVAVDQLQTLNHLFERYRRNAARLSLAGLALVAGSVLLLYGPRRGLRIVIVPLGACALSFGVLGWLGETLNLFHLLGAFLGVCLSHDYAIFAVNRIDPEGAPPASVRLAAATTAASFAVLAFSRIPVIHALGITVALAVLIGWAMVELLARRRTPGS